MIFLFLIHEGGIVFLREYKDDIKKTQRLQLSFECMLTNEMMACFRITEQDSAKCRRGEVSSFGPSRKTWRSRSQMKVCIPIIVMCSSLGCKYQYYYIRTDMGSKLIASWPERIEPTL